MSRYFACKPHGHDSGVFYVDCAKKELFGLNLDAVTRMKRDRGHVSLMREYFGGVDHFYNPGPREFEALREILPLEMGLLEHPIRQIVVHPLLSGEEKLKKARNLYNAEITKQLETWLKIEECINASGAKYHCIGQTKWNELNQRRLPGVKSITTKNHHLCHAFAAYLHSGFEDPAVVVIDGYGDGDFTTVYEGSRGQLTKRAATELTYSWGLLYGWVTRALGYVHNEDEGKIEALASFGAPDAQTYEDWMEAYRINDNLVIQTDREILSGYFVPPEAHLRRLAERIGAESLAATVQTFLQDKAAEYISAIIKTTGRSKIVLSGGVCANVKMNQAIFEQSGLEELYIVPAMNDPGSTQGAAYLAAAEAGEDLNWIKDCVMPYWGPSFSRADIIAALKDNQNRISWQEISAAKAAEFVADLVISNKVIAFFQGAREFGPRALGNRSILANALGGSDIKDRINNVVKRRRNFQPFCPSVLASERERLFERSYANKHMTCAFTVKAIHREKLKAVVHVDHTARPQFVDEKDNFLFHALLQTLRDETGYGVVLNTSFNLHGRAMVLSPRDALDDLCDCGLDGLWLDGFWVTVLNCSS